MPFPIRTSFRVLSLGALLLPATGCELIGQLMSGEVEIPIPLETPEQEIDVTENVEAAEDRLCEDPESEDCLVVKALDLSDDEMVSEPPRVPAEFPAEVDPDGDGPEAPILVEDWMAENELGEASDLKLVVPVELADQVGVEKEQVKDVRFDSVALSYKANSLTFDSLPMDLYASEGPLPDGTSLDADALVAQGLVKKVGTIPAQPAGTTGDANVEFVEGGNEIFNTALKSMSFVLVAAVPEGTRISLSPGEEAGTLKKPLGQASLTIKAQLFYKVSAADVAEAAERAQN